MGEIDILYETLNRLTQAQSPAEQLEAVSSYARSSGATGGVLFFLEQIDTDEAWSQVVAAWFTDSGHAIETGTRMRAFATSLVRRDSPLPPRPILISDTATDPRIDSPTRALFDGFKVRALVQLPLNNQGRWIGSIIFGWNAPHQFNERDERIYTALLQQITPVIDSTRLLELTRNRALQLEAASQEIDILYTALNKLNQAKNPVEQLESVSDYPRLNGATQGILFYIQQPQALPLRTAEVAAEWVLDPRQAAGVGTLWQTLEFEFSRQVLAGHERPYFVEDMQRHHPVDAEFRQLMESRNIHAAVILPLFHQGTGVGILWFSWSQPRTFNDLDRRIYTAMLQQATPVISTLRLLEYDRERAIRSEYLLRINTALSQAADETVILEAIALYAAENAADLMTLDYPDEQTFYRVAIWEAGQARLCNFEVSALPESHGLQQPLFVEDSLNDDRLKGVDTPISRAFVMLPLYSGGDYQGVLTIGWNQPHTFSAQEHYIYTSLMRTLPSVVAVRRAFLTANEAWQESELLYWASKHINAATTFEGIVEAVESMHRSNYNVVLTRWENFDFDHATYADIVAGSSRAVRLVGTRHPIVNFPIFQNFPRDRITVIEDVLNDARVDPVSAENWLKLNTRSRISVPMMLNNRWMGNLIFFSEQPRAYSEFEQRLIGGIGELVTAAMERIRLQMETEASRKHAEMLAQISAGLSQAQDEQEILTAVAPLAQRYHAVLSMLAYASTDENGDIVEVKTVAIASPEVGYMDTSDLPLLAFQFKDFPHLQVAYEKPDEVIFVQDAKTFGWPTTAIVPLQTGSQWQGILTFMWTTPQTFSEEMHRDFAAIQPAAASIVASRRAFLRERQRAHELETVAKVSAVAASILDVDKLLKSVTELVHLNFPDYQIFIYLLDDSGKTLTLASGYRRFGNLQNVRIELSCKDWVVSRAGQLRRGMIVNDIVKSKEFTPMPMLPNARSEIAVPMAAGDRLIGVLNVQSQITHRFSEADLWVMGALADLIAVAIQNARLYKRAQEGAVLEERNRLARELHDSVSQALYGIALGARTAHQLWQQNPALLGDPLNYILSLAEGGLNEMRALIFELRPETLENEGLISALTKQTVSIQTRHNISVQTHFCPEPDVPVNMKEAVYRIAREALHNITKHAHATQVVVRIQCDAVAMSLEIVDNGAGFDPNGDFPGHLGLKSMRERAQKLNGSCEIVSAPGHGTAIMIRIPRPLVEDDLQLMTENPNPA
jgi:signal transduction histidine kinase